MTAHLQDAFDAHPIHNSSSSSLLPSPTDQSDAVDIPDEDEEEYDRLREIEIENMQLNASVSSPRTLAPIQPTLSLSSSGNPSPHHPNRTGSSASSSTNALDSYYFSYPSPVIGNPPSPYHASPPPHFKTPDVPVPPHFKTPDLPASMSFRSPDTSFFNASTSGSFNATHSRTPDMTAYHTAPQTPARADPGGIDRKGLIGVGELATPRWVQAVGDHVRSWDRPMRDERRGTGQSDEYFKVPKEKEGRSGMDERRPSLDERDVEERDVLPLSESDWAIPHSNSNTTSSEWEVSGTTGSEWEMVEESNPRLPPSSSRPIPKAIRHKPSMNSESGGEEILYKPPTRKPAPAVPPLPHDLSIPDSISLSEQSPLSPASGGERTRHRQRKRTSEEYNTLDRHRSIGPGTTVPPPVPARRDREKRRVESVVGLGISSPGSSTIATTPAIATSRSQPLPLSTSRERERERDRHSRHASSSTSMEASTITITPSSSRRTAEPPSPHHQAHPSPSVGHALLRGNQEGWAGLDDVSTAEALRRLDGVGSSAKVRNRMSKGSSAGSRPTTPGEQRKTRASVGSLKEKSRGGGEEEMGDLVLSGGVGQQGQGLEDEGVREKHHHRKSLNGKERERERDQSQRSSYGVAPTAKRGSVGSAGTPTTTNSSSARDSTTLSSTTSNTSISLSNRHSTSLYGAASKQRRNSAGSDASSVHSLDRAALLASGEYGDDEEQRIPPVPPLPKDLANYRSPLPSSTATTFGAAARESPRDPYGQSPREPLVHVPTHEDPDRTINVPSIDVPSPSAKQLPVTPAKGPSKKWSFSGLSLHLPGSGSRSDGASPRNSRAMSLAVQSQERLDYSSPSEYEHMHRTPSKKGHGPVWSPPVISPDMPTATAEGYFHSPSIPAGTPDRQPHSRAGTASSASTTLPPPPVPLSPKRSGSSKRLTPSAIPFFRRSSSQSMQVKDNYPKSSGESDSPTGPIHHAPQSSVSTSGTEGSTTSRKSVLSFMKGSGSRKSLHVEKPSMIEVKQRERKEEKERSESRISVLMGRKRGKTLSATDSPKKSKEPALMPPMQMAAISTSTANRVAGMKPPSTLMTPTKSAIARTQPSPSQSQASNLSKASDASLRSTRQQLPTIAGSPSVGPVQGGPPVPSSLGPSQSNATLNGSMREKDTPTKIPRISGRTSQTSSPQSSFRGQERMTNARRTSLNNSSMSNVSSNHTEVPPSPQMDFGMSDEFGVVKPGTSAPASVTARGRSSPQSISRVPRRTEIPSSASSVSKRPIPRESMSYTTGGLRKSSSNSIASLSTSEINVTSQNAPMHHTVSAASRLSAISPSKPLKMLSPKLPHANPRLSTSATFQSSGSPSSGRQSLSTPSPVPSGVDEDEILGDEEMMAYIRRTQARRMAAGARREDLDEVLKFPEPCPPVPPSSPNAILKSSQAVYLSDYERREILDFPQVYCIGARSEKKPATRDSTTNNHGYDDERGDYLVVNGDHLAYRYEIIGTLGKGSFGQVLHCRDHATGQSVAIKIIRNKKRFHHQALVEIKILDNLRKWDAEEKHHVIKMTEHFYFRQHLCIAMELLSINLYELIKANGFVGFSTTLIRRFTSQMLASLALMRHHRIVHCDLKPENVLLRRPDKSAIKVIDFGSSCFEYEKVYTYIQSRFYRSPEVILGMNYHMAIDMWSLGCILAELYTGFPIFPGENEQEQLSCIMEVLGIPERDLINRSSRKKLFFDSTGAPRPVVNSKGRRRKPGTKSLAQVLRCEDEHFIDFIAKCLVWDPERRLKPAPAMRHPFLNGGRKPKPLASAAAATRSLLSSSSSVSNRVSRTHPPQETPRKSLISAPTPLAARVSSSRALTTTGVPSTPTGSSGNHAPLTNSSTRSYYAPTNGAVYHQSPRSVAGTSSTYVSTKTS